MIAIELKESLSILDMSTLKKRGKHKYSKKHIWEHEQTIGNRVGRDGKIAFVHQIIDRPTNYYKKYVEQGQKTIKNLMEQLTQHL